MLRGPEQHHLSQIILSPVFQLSGSDVLFAWQSPAPITELPVGHSASGTSLYICINPHILDTCAFISTYICLPPPQIWHLSQHFQNPAPTGANPTMPSSSTKAHSGSHGGSSSSHNSTSSHSHTHSTISSSSKDKSSSEIVDRFVREERDHRSFAVEEFDAHQESAKQSHADTLMDVVGKNY